MPDSALPGPSVTELCAHGRALIFSVAREVYARPHPGFTWDEIVSSTSFALVQAAVRWPVYCQTHNYDPSLATSGSYFLVYARTRMRGAIKDEQRLLDPYTRSERTQQSIDDPSSDYSSHRSVRHNPSNPSNPSTASNPSNPPNPSTASTASNPSSPQEQQNIPRPHPQYMLRSTIPVDFSTHNAYDTAYDKYLESTNLTVEEITSWNETAAVALAAYRALTPQQQLVLAFIVLKPRTLRVQRMSMWQVATYSTGQILRAVASDLSPTVSLAPFSHAAALQLSPYPEIDEYLAQSSDSSSSDSSAVSQLSDSSAVALSPSRQRRCLLIHQFESALTSEPGLLVDLAARYRSTFRRQTDTSSDSSAAPSDSLPQ